MHNQFESLPGVYDKNKKNWQKSANEIANFILNGLEGRQQFFEFICGEDVENNRASRWQEQLLNLLAKAQKRMGYQINNQELLMAARNIILEQSTSGQLSELDVYEKFCGLAEEDFKLKA
ncbi:MAG: hypothetical protein PHE20_02420 [Patescibacteria group bacterium]|nr:hypothetical protein [Patescibacteria group bacterium]